MAQTRQLKILTDILHAANHLLWPNYCSICKEFTHPENQHLCVNCWQHLLECIGGDYCPGCGKDVSRYAIYQNRCPACTDKQISYDSIARVGFYDKTLRKMILSFKSGNCEIGNKLAELLRNALLSTDFKNEVDLFVPVPLFWLRKLKRGYNQSHILAKTLKLNISTDLVRIKNTRYQTMMVTEHKRAANVKNAFAVRKNHPFKGKNICLVDDIKTTGATLNECAKTLRLAGAEKVYALVLAVAGRAD